MPDPETSRRRRGWLGLAALALVVVQIPVLIRTASDPTQSDFGNYFVPARVVASGGAVGALYDRDTFDRARVDAGIAGLGSFVPHPPANALWLAPFARLGAGTAKLMWTLILLAAAAGCVACVRAIDPAHGWPGALLVVFGPTLAMRNGLAFGQPYLVLSAMLLVGACLWQQGHVMRAAFMLGLGASFKPYALPLGALLLGRRRGTAILWFLAGAVLPTTLLTAWNGTSGVTEFTMKVLPWLLRGEIQDPFSAGWGSVHAFTNRLFRFEPDLNPRPWVDAPAFAVFAAPFVSCFIAVSGLLAGRRAVASDRPGEGIAIAVAALVAASPLVGSYHLVLLFVTIGAVGARLSMKAWMAWLLLWGITGSSIVNGLRGFEDAPAPLHFIRLFLLIAIAAVAGRDFVTFRNVAIATGLGFAAGGVSLLTRPRAETWARVDEARGYSAMRPFFENGELGWWSPSEDGKGYRRRSATHREEGIVPVLPSAIQTPGNVKVVSRFTEGSMNLFLRIDGRADEQVTFSSANEVEPVLSPDGCSVVFASDQHRGLGSTALYRIDVSRFIRECERSPPSAVRP